MALNPLIDSRDVRHILFDLFEIDKIGKKYKKFEDQDKDLYDETINLAERIAVNQFYPVNAEGDKTGCKYDPETKEVMIPEFYKGPINTYYESGFLGLVEDTEIGGMGMPIIIDTVCMEYFTSSNMSLMSYPGLAHGAMNLIKTFGTDEQKRMFMEKMFTGQYGGDMALTEPDAGSDVGALKTKAVKQKDGTYLITGQKIFITSAENDYYENIIHPVLARIEGDPPGTKGISIFLVPKFLVNDDGTLGERNDVVCTGIEHKLGLKGSATCSLSFGDNGKCIGYLLGEERKGMKIMFQLMNEARLMVGLQGLAMSSIAYMHAVTYAKNRVQGSHITQMMNPDAASVPIIQHPDVKRMLLWMKSHVEGMRLLNYYLAYKLDIEHCGDEEEKKEAKAIVDLLLPVCKAGNTDMSVLVTSEAIQVYGGYGYCSDYPVEQYFRDAKILTIYEGTNGIQSLDLTMRKILMNQGQYNYAIFQKEVEKTIKNARGIVDEKYIKPVEKGIKQLDEVIQLLKEYMQSMKVQNIFIKATEFQQTMFMLALAWLHLWSLTFTIPKKKELIGNAKGDELNKILDENPEAAYYSGRVLSAQFYIGSEFNKFSGRIEQLKSKETSVIKANDFTFTGAPEE